MHARCVCARCGKQEASAQLAAQLRAWGYACIEMPPGAHALVEDVTALALAFFDLPQVIGSHACQGMPVRVRMPHGTSTLIGQGTRTHSTGWHISYTC